MISSTILLFCLCLHPMFEYASLSSAQGHGHSPFVLVVVPGFGFDPGRAASLQNTLLNLNSSTCHFKCIVFNYEEPADRVVLPNNMRETIESLCEIQNYYYGNYAVYLKSISPTLARLSGVSHVMVLLDDVELKNSFRLDEAVDIMTRNKLSIVTPGVFGANVAATQHIAKGSYKIGHVTYLIEIFATIFTAEAWGCFWDLLDPMVNSAGFGYEMYLFPYCRDRIPDFTMGIIDSMLAIHHVGLGLAGPRFVPADLPLSIKLKRYQRVQLKETWVKLMARRFNLTDVEYVDPKYPFIRHQPHLI